MTALAIATTARGQGTVGNGTFQDLDFEEANPQPAAGGGVTLPSAFPGWSGFVEGASQSTANYNLITLGSPEIALIGANGPVPVVSGGYSALLVSSSSQLFPQDVSISQTGVLPSDAESIQMKVNSIDGKPFDLALGANTIPMEPLFVASSYTIYGGNVSLFGGKSEQLSITVPAPGPGPSDMSPIVFDDIFFSSQIVPEPSTLVLFGLTGIVFLTLTRRERR
jgi:hypothetical protein